MTLRSWVIVMSWGSQLLPTTKQEATWGPKHTAVLTEEETQYLILGVSFPSIIHRSFINLSESVVTNYQIHLIMKLITSWSHYLATRHFAPSNLTYSPFTGWSLSILSWIFLSGSLSDAPIYSPGIPHPGSET